MQEFFTYRPVTEQPRRTYKAVRVINRNQCVLTLNTPAITTVQPTGGGYCAVNYNLDTLLPAGFTIVKGQRFVGLTGVVPCVSWVADGRQYRFRLIDLPGACPFDFYGGQLIPLTEAKVEYWANGLTSTVELPTISIKLGTLTGPWTTTTYTAEPCVNTGGGLSFGNYLISCL